jgi:hypothetical protein
MARGATSKKQQPPLRASVPKTTRSASTRSATQPGTSAIVATDDAALRIAEAEISRRVVLIEADEMARFLQDRLGQKLTAYLAGIKDVKAVGQWARGRAEPSAIVRERLRAAYHVTALLAGAYGDRAAQAWLFGANSSLDDQAPAAALRSAETPDETARIVPLARAFVRGAS